jgi:hypothetical protein
MTFTINVSEDGNEWCAIIGEMPTEVAVGFGKTVCQALLDLINNMDSDLLNATCGSD